MNYLSPSGSRGAFSLLLFALVLAAALLVARGAARRGSSPVAWGAIAFLLGPIGWLLHAINASHQDRRARAVGNQTRR